ncbi:MAG: hypothetical protein DRJ68_04180 [Thermoprotei archaeon]|nr:MAG: hypothetical protein DRJ62_01195 [Thermoprotei archaeon]RLF21145.1 MAG: hypothetical protein DRJ68_04180 [Thermoprotei archaeon]
MRIRNVQLVGKYTYTLSLPKDWIQRWNLKKGDKLVIVEDEDGSLRVSPELKGRAKQLSQYRINADKCSRPWLLERLLVGNYMLGKETVEIVSERGIKPEHLMEVRKALRRLTGLSIVEESQNHVVLQCLIEPIKFPVEKLIRRLYALTSIMHSDSVKALLDKDKELAISVLQRETEADMVYWLTVRQLVMAADDRSIARDIGIKDIKHQQGLRVVAKSLESIADQAENIARACLSLIDFNLSLDEEVILLVKEFSQAVGKINNRAIDAYFKCDLYAANDAINESKETEKYEIKINEVASSVLKDPRLLMIVYKVADSLRSMTRYAADIAEIAINRFLAESTSLI